MLVFTSRDGRWEDAGDCARDEATDTRGEDIVDIVVVVW